MRVPGWLAGLAVVVPTLGLAAMEDDPLLFKVMIDQFETRAGEGRDPWALDAQAWVGKDLRKLWVKAELNRVGADTGEAELQVLYDRALTPHWNLRAGWRRDTRPEPERDWLALGVDGIAPYWIEFDAALFLGEEGRGSARFQAEYELLFTQRWVLVPELEINLYSQNDAAVGIGAGLSDVELGMRLRYEIRREVAPYLGVNWARSFGNTADLARSAGEDVEDLRLVAGVRAWF